ncbi:lactate utilization protein C [Evansella sp. AB-P1]|uniref:LutC/YkgG family protein n=1 Tax=Evansella sp. AB-P1 TaxID=3037653 RepID=UPI00241D26F5|nr:lactate utilization protein C [Evansella sp. AB-P1]MDG5786461.1 lactate utilization protein C [Evansella sp. AB-P1]
MTERGMIQNKDRFLNNIANKLGRKRQIAPVEIPKWSKLPQYEVFKDHSQDELMNELVQHCSKIHTSVTITSRDRLKETFHEEIKKLGGQSIVHWNDERFDQFELTGALREQQKEQGVDVHAWKPELGNYNIKKAEQANIGITFADIALAESGTVVLLSDSGKGRSVSLLPRKYLAVIPKSIIVARMTQATEKIHEIAEEKGRMPSCINFISGPSNSADIELRLVVGVHGPVEATYIIIEDA